MSVRIFASLKWHAVAPIPCLARTVNEKYNSKKPLLGKYSIDYLLVRILFVLGKFCEIGGIRGGWRGGWGLGGLAANIGGRGYVTNDRK